MTLHLVKLCVGCDSVEDLAGWIAERRRQAHARGERFQHGHVTRMTPKRIPELLDGGSLYWVIRGIIQARQRITDVRPFVDREGIGRCRLVLAARLVRTEFQPRRPFQGWRYLPAADSPCDLAVVRGDRLPPSLSAELAAIGVR